MASKTAKRQELFAREYVIDFNATRAATAAGYSQKTAAEQGSRLLKKVKVSGLVDKLISARASKLEITALKLDEETSRLAFANMQDYMRVNADGWPELDLSALTRDQAAAIQEFSEDATGGQNDGERRLVLRRRFKLADKSKNLELLYRRLGLLKDNLKVDGMDGLAERLNQLRDKKNGDSRSRP